MHRPSGSLEIGTEYQVIVNKILANGIIVQIKDTKFTDFIHISKISTNFVSNINDYVNVGDILTAIAVKSLAKRNDEHDGFELSLQHLQLKSLYDNTCYSCVDDNSNTSEKRLNDMILDADNSLKDKLRAMQRRSQKRRK